MTVVVASHPLRSGQVVTPEDVVPKTVPAAAGQGALTQVDAVQGRTLLVDVNADQPLFASFTLGSHSIPAGSAAVPLRPADGAVAEVVHPGERLDVVGQRTSEDPVGVIARDVSVLTVTTPRTTGLLKSATEAPMVVVLTDPATAADLAAATLAGPIALTLRN